MKMLVFLCLISSLAILQSTILHSVNVKSETNESEKDISEEFLRVKRNSAIVKNIVKSDEDPSLILVKWFKSVIDGNLELKPENSELNNNIIKNKPAKNFFEDCANDGYFNISDTLVINEKGQYEGQGKMIYDRKALCRMLHQIHSIEGKIVKGHPYGEATIMYRDGSHSNANFDNQGVLDGLNVRFWCKFGACNEFELEAWRKPRHLKEISTYNKGYKSGINYEFKSGGGFIVGLDDLSGPDVAYVYPDMKTMIVGQFKKGQLISGLEAELTGLAYAENGLLRPLYEIKGQKSITYSISNQTWIGSDPLIRDPLEEKYLYVGNSSMEGAGRGVFLKTKARKGFIVGFYNGVRMTDIESKVKSEDRKSPYRIDNDWARSNEILNMPMHYRSLEIYNATLGHLINHNKKPNSWYGMIDHPRFGKIRSIVLLKDLEANEELFADYGYLEQYASSESMIKSLYHASKWFMNKSDDEFHKDMKFHIKYMKKKVEDLKPYMGIFKTITNMIK